MNIIDKISCQKITESQATLNVDKMIMMQGLDESSGYVPANMYQSHQVSPIFFVSSNK